MKIPITRWHRFTHRGTHYRTRIEFRVGLARIPGVIGISFLFWLVTDEPNGQSWERASESVNHSPQYLREILRNRLEYNKPSQARSGS